MKTQKSMKVTKHHLKKSQLTKLGKMTLAQKIKKAAEGAETAEEAATNLKELLTKQEHSKVWSKHNVALQKKQKRKRKNSMSFPKMKRACKQHSTW